MTGGAVDVDGSLDMAWNSDLEDADTGQTVGGTTTEDTGEMTTTAWPSELDRDNYTDREAEVIEYACLNPKASQSQLGEAVGYSKSVVTAAVEKAAEDADPDDISFLAWKQEAKRLAKDGKSASKIAEELDVTLQQAVGTIQNISTGENQENSSTEPTDTSDESESDSGTEFEPATTNTTISTTGSSPLWLRAFAALGVAWIVVQFVRILRR